MSNVLNRFKDFIGINEPDDLDEDYYDEEEMDDSNYSTQPHVGSNLETEQRHRSQRRPHFTTETQELKTTSSKSNVIGMPGANNGLNEIVMLEPQSFEKMAEVIQVLRERKTVILNLNMMEPDDAQRAVDFVAGGTYAIDGHQERVGESIFLFTPSCVQVTSRSHTTQGTAPHQSATQANVHPMPSSATWQKEQNPIAQ
ncbi:MAG: cell division protein SepF [Cyanobacteria bacterium]|jgi:cell division inhibitor SepF|nr:cell division protein SepF [Cyanobacteria bacterium GSL.Bin21]